MASKKDHIPTERCRSVSGDIAVYGGRGMDETVVFALPSSVMSAVLTVTVIKAEIGLPLCRNKLKARQTSTPL